MLRDRRERGPDGRGAPDPHAVGGARVSARRRADPETFTATVTIDTKLKTPTAKNLYETAVIMSLEEADIEVEES